MKAAFLAAAAGLLAATLAHANASLPGLRLVSSDARGATLEYRLDRWSLDPVTTPEGPMTRVTIPGFGALSEAGRPALPASGVWIAIPPIGSATVRVIEEEIQSVPAIRAFPAPRLSVTGDDPAAPRVDAEFVRDGNAYASNAPYPAAVATLESPMWLRFQRVQALRLAPIRYVAASRELRVTRRLVLRVEFSNPGNPGAAALRAAGLALAPASDGGFEGIYRGAVVNAAQARGWRARPLRGGATANAASSRSAPRVLGTGNPEWKVRIDTTGVWRVRFDQLTARGWPNGIAISAVTAFLRDTTVDLEPVPWVSNEIPIDVIDINGNGLFDGQDFLVLPVRSWADRTSPGRYERRYGDYDVVWLSYKSSGSGLRVTTRPGWYSAAHPVAPRSFLSSRRYEQQYQYDTVIPSVTTQDQYFWTDGFSDATPIDSLTADLLDLDAGGGNVTVSATWFGRRAIPHTVNASWVSQVGETPLWTGETFFGRVPFTRQQSFPAALASLGINRLRISGSSSNPAGSLASFDAFDVTYPRFYVARNNRLEFTSGGATDTIEIRLEGFVAGTRPPVYAYDVTDGDHPARLAVGPDQVITKEATWRVFLQDTVGAGRTHRYVAAVDVASLPDAAITAETPSSLYATPAYGADFVILANDAFASAVQPLADYRRLQGVSTLVAKTQDVYDEFNGGRKSLFAIRRFLRYAIDHWNTRYALLVGDGSEDAQGWLGTSDVDYLPTPVINSPIGVSDGASVLYQVVPTDHWYALALTGGDPGTDLLADMIVGRWTAGSVTETQNLVSKSILYETAHLGETWRSRAVMIADDRFSSGTSFGGGGFSEYCASSFNQVFTTISRDVEQVITTEGGYASYDLPRFELNSLLASQPTFAGTACDTARDLNATRAYTRAAVTPSLLSQLGQGAAFVNFQGYGNAYVLTHENLYQSQGSLQDLGAVSNTNKPWIFTGFTAFANSFANVSERSPSLGDAMGERMVNAAGKGAIASFSSTSFEVLPYDAANHLNVHVYRAFFVDPPDSSGPGRVIVGEGLALGVARMLASNANSLERSAALTYVLLGDPLAALRIPGTVDVPERTHTSALSLEAPRPSPAHGSVSIPFALARAARVRLALYDPSGRRVRVLHDGALPAGTHEIRWDGRGANGGTVGPGVYFCRLEMADGGSEPARTRRMVWLR